MISIEHATKTIDKKIIFADITLDIEQGNIFGLIGPNGAGKTSLIKCITGIWNIEKGKILVHGKNPFKEPQIKQEIGYIPDQNHFYNSFCVNEVARLYQLTYNTFNTHRFHTLTSQFNIPENKKIRELSRGIKMKLSIILSLAIRPQVIIIDEFLTGLDPIIKKNILNLLIREVAENKTTLFLSTHNLTDLERICDYLALIHHGRIIYHDSYDHMKRSIQKIQVVFKDSPPGDIVQWEGIKKFESLGRLHYIYFSGNADKISGLLKKHGALFIDTISMSLEELVVHQIGGGKTYEDIFP